MLAKLALRNVHRSARDYAIYFVTVALGVAMFYAFNTISDQAVLFDALSDDSLRMLDMLNTMMGLLSGVIVCVLGFLVVYANRFLIRRRRREFGTYLMLGMSAGRVSRILLLETVIVGCASLVVGLALGIAFSQGLSFATAALMGTTMTKYRFIVSGSAIAFTIACFAAIFVLSALIDIIYIRRCKLAALLSAHQANEGHAKVNAPVRVAAFAVSLAVLACAYWRLSVNGLVVIDGDFWIATALMIVGTFLFFWSVAGFVTALLQRMSQVYFRRLSCFTVRQISSKINTAFASMSVVSIMLFFALTISSVGMGLVEVFVGNIEEISAYDMTVQAAPSLLDSEDLDSNGENTQLFERYDGDMAACIKGEAEGEGANTESAAGADSVDGARVTWDNFVEKTTQVDYYLVGGDDYETAMKYGDVLSQVPEAYGALDDGLRDSAERMEVQVMGVSQFNALCALTGKRGVMLEDNECAVNNLLPSTDEVAQALCDEKVSLTVGDAKLHFAGRVQHVPVRNGAMVDVVLEVIVPDYVVDSMKAAGQKPWMSVLAMEYRVDRAEGDVLFSKYMHQAFPPQKNVQISMYDGETVPEDQIFHHGAWPCFQNWSGREMADQASGMRMVITYLAVYIGFVLLVATAAILAIQQLSETADSLGRYRRLRDLGADERWVHKSLRTQTVVYFVAPLLLALCHTACAVKVITDTLFSEVGVNVLGSVAIAGGAVLAIYAVYLVITYALSRSIVSAER